jgi:hypothetical protein
MMAKYKPLETVANQPDQPDPPVGGAKIRKFPVLAEAAFHGLAGAIVRTIEPHSEGDPVALLLALHAFFDNADREQFRARGFVMR